MTAIFFWNNPHIYIHIYIWKVYSVASYRIAYFVARPVKHAAGRPVWKLADGAACRHAHEH